MAKQSNRIRLKESLITGVIFIALFAVSLFVLSNITSNEQPKENDSNDISPDRITCQIDEPVAGGGSSEVLVSVTSSTQTAPQAHTEFLGVSASVTYFTGDQYEPQTYLSMQLTKDEATSVSSILYDYQLKEKAGPINVLSLEDDGKPVRLQCWLE